MTILDELLFELERAFADPREQAVRLHVWLYAKREDLAALKELRRAMNQATEGR